MQPVAVISLRLQNPVASEPSTSDADHWKESHSKRIDSRLNTIYFLQFAAGTGLDQRKVGAALLRHALAFAERDLGAGGISCLSRLENVNFYREHGMEVCGPTVRKGPSLYCTPMRIVQWGNEARDGA